MAAQIQFLLNGSPQQVLDEDALMMVSDYLRYRQQKTGTKVVCAEGDCGACTILVYHPEADKKFRSVNSCITPVFSLAGQSVVTIEGLKKSDQLHPVQQSLVENFGSQCGFCTPGIACTMATLHDHALDSNQLISEQKAKNYLTGHLCRCTGYLPILDSVKNSKLDRNFELQQRYAQKEQFEKICQIAQNSILLNSSGVELFIPVSLDEALEYKNKNPEAHLVAGGTDLGVLINKGRLKYTKVISLQNISELYLLTNKKEQILIGARVTLSEVEAWAKTQASEFANLLSIFASPQIKNRATLVGNIVNGSPIGDTIPFLMSCNATLVIQSVHGKRRVAIEDFYLAYKKMDLLPNEIVVGIEIPTLQMSHKLYKASVRKDLDISAVTFAAAYQLGPAGFSYLKIFMGGVGPTVLRLRETEKIFLSAQSRNLFLAEAQAALLNEVSPRDDVRGSAHYRQLVCQNFLARFVSETLEQI